MLWELRDRIKGKMKGSNYMTHCDTMVHIAHDMRLEEVCFITMTQNTQPRQYRSVFGTKVAQPEPRHEPD